MSRYQVKFDHFGLQSEEFVPTVSSEIFVRQLARRLLAETNISDYFSSLCVYVNPSSPILRPNFPRTFVMTISTEPHVVSAYPRSSVSKIANHVVLSVVDPGSHSEDCLGFVPWFPEDGVTFLHSTRPHSKSGVTLVSGTHFSANRESLYDFRLQVANALAASGVSVQFGGSASIKGPTMRSKISSFLDQSLTPKSLSLRFRSSSLDSRVNRLGRVSNLAQFFASGECAVVIENDIRYTSEKVFQALAAGVRVVYVGKSLKHLGFDSDLVLEAPASIQGVLEAVHRARELPYPGDAYRSWCERNSEHLRLMTPSSCANRVLDLAVTRTSEHLNPRYGKRFSLFHGQFL